MLSKSLIPVLLVLLGMSFLGCDRPFSDPAAPELDIVSPDLSKIQLSDNVVLTIAASSFRRIASATVNGVEMTEDGSTGNWSVDWTLRSGVNALAFSVTDEDGTTADTTEYAVRMDYNLTPRLDAMKVATGGHATTVTFNGALLVTGGTEVAGAAATSRAELLPAGGTIFQTLAGTMVNARSGHSATLLSDGRILIAGGSVKDDITAIVDLVEEPEVFQSRRPVV